MDFGDYFRFLLALVFVLAMIGILALLARRAGLGYAAGLARGSGQQRIQVIETAQVDGRRRLVLVKRDDVEHLLILGQNSETVIETGITPPTDRKILTPKHNRAHPGAVQKLTGTE